MCLRPCQAVVGVEEYRSEADRVADFLTSNGKHQLEAVEHARERLSAEMQFEEAARQHKRAQRIADVLKLRDEVTREAGSLNGVAVLPSTNANSILLMILLGGVWQQPCYFSVGLDTQPAVSIDHRLRELLTGLAPETATIRERQEHLALWARWYYSSWRDGTWIQFNSRESVPWRRLVNAIIADRLGTGMRREALSGAGPFRIAQAELLQDRDHRAPVGECRLEQIESHERREQIPALDPPNSPERGSTGRTIPRSCAAY